MSMIIMKNSNIGWLTLLLQSVAVLTATTLPLHVNAEKCKQSDGMWGDVNPNIFYICDNATNTAIQLQCAEGRGFFNGLGYYGCIPFEQWPACISGGGAGSAGSAAAGQTQQCDAAHITEPWESVNPNKFYMCRAEHAQPQLVNCEPGKGFINVSTGGSGGNAAGNAARIVGCTSWEKWRGYMQCMSYY